MKLDTTRYTLHATRYTLHHKSLNPKLAQAEGKEFKYSSMQTTFAHCCLDMDSCTCSLARSSHPITLNSMHPVVVVRSMQRRSFFARKFSPNQEPEHWEAVWNNEGEPLKAMEAAQLALSLSVNPSTL